MQTIPTELFNKVYAEYLPRLQGFAEKIVYSEHTAEDCVQEVFRKLLLQDFNKIKDHLHPWLFLVCRNTCLKFLKKNSRIELQNEQEEELSDIKSPIEFLVCDEKYKEMFVAIESLTPKEKNAITLKYFSGLKYEQIAEKMNIKKGNAGFHISTGMKKLRKILSENLTSNNI
jgi:RNA polymerase sigma-70 factor (ECF subfamily)